MDKLADRAFVGKAIAEARKKCGLTQASVATQAGVSRSYLADVESGRTMPSLKCLLALSQVVALDLTFLSKKGDGHDYSL